MPDLLIWAASYAIYCTAYMLALGAVGIVIEICETLREGWSGENSEI